MKAIQIISQDLFDKVRSRFSNLEMGDETGAVTIDPSEARFFDFDFVKEGVDLGRVSISLADPGSLKVYYSQGITEGQDSEGKQIWYDFLKEMRQFAMRRLLRFDTRDIAKNNLDKNDFQHLAATQAPKEDDMTSQMTESRWTNKSTKKTSRAVRGTTEVIVRHNRSVDEMYPGARSQRKNIKAIFIQNRDGERFKYPFIHPAGAFAMAQHVDHGGVPHDPAGKAIISMSEQIAQLQEFQRKIQHQTLHDDAMGISERAVGKLQELKARMEALSKRQHYESWIAEFNETEQPVIGELDAVTLETYKQAFTQTSFNEELANLFPLIHSIMQEKIDLEEYVADRNDEEILGTLAGGALGAVVGGPLGALTGAAAGDSLTDPDADEVETKKEAFSEFEEWADAMEEGKLTSDQIESLKYELENMAQSGQKLNFDTAYEFFQQFGIDDPQLEKDFQSQADLDASVDPLKTFKDWAAEAYPEILGPLSAVLPQDQVAAPAPVPAEQPAVENDDMQWTNNMMSNISEGRHMDEVYHRVAEMIKSRFNKDNPTVGPFNGQEGILLDVEKEIKEKYGEEVGQHARQVAEKFMERLSQKWAAKHKPALMGEKGVAEGSGQAIFSKIAASGDDAYDMIYDGLVGKFGEEARVALQDMYDEIAVNSRLHPDDDFEEIQSRMLDQIEQGYSMSEQPDEGNAFGMQARYADKGDKFTVGDQEYIKSEDDAELEAMSRHAKGWEKYGPGMKELAKAGKAGASEKEMDRLRKKHNRYDEEIELIRKLSGMAK